MASRVLQPTGDDSGGAHPALGNPNGQVGLRAFIPVVYLLTGLLGGAFVEDVAPDWLSEHKLEDDAPCKCSNFSSNLSVIRSTERGGRYRGRLPQWLTKHTEPVSEELMELRRIRFGKAIQRSRKIANGEDPDGDDDGDEGDEPPAKRQADDASSPDSCQFYKCPHDCTVTALARGLSCRWDASRPEHQRCVAVLAPPEAAPPSPSTDDGDNETDGNGACSSEEDADVQDDEADGSGSGGSEGDADAQDDEADGSGGGGSEEDVYLAPTSKAADDASSPDRCQFYKSPHACMVYARTLGLECVWNPARNPSCLPAPPCMPAVIASQSSRDVAHDDDTQDGGDDSDEGRPPVLRPTLKAKPKAMPRGPARPARPKPEPKGKPSATSWVTDRLNDLRKQQEPRVNSASSGDRPEPPRSVALIYNPEKKKKRKRRRGAT